MKKNMLKWVAIVGPLLVPAAAHATEATNTLSVSATVNSVCLVDAATMTFDAVDSIGGTGAAPEGVASTGTVGVKYACTNGTTPSAYVTDAAVSLSGTNGNTETLTANLYQSDNTTAFPSTSVSALELGAATGSTQTLTINGKLTTNTTTKADTYTGQTDVNIVYN